METNTLAGPEQDTAASNTPITKLSDADMALLQSMIGAAIGAAVKTVAVPAVPPSVTSAQLFEAAKVLAKTTSRDELNKWWGKKRIRQPVSMGPP